MTPDINSYSLIIRDGILDRLKAVPTFQSVKLFARNRLKGPIQKENLPFLGCYLIEETLTPDGDANHGEPRFFCAAKVGFSIIIESADEGVAEQNLDSAHWSIMNLLTQQAWHRFKLPSPYPPVRIESISRGSRKFHYGNAGNNNETPIGELQMDLTINHRQYFPPYVPDDLNLIHVTVAYPWPYDPTSQEPFTVVYDLTSQ